MTAGLLLELARGSTQRVELARAREAETSLIRRALGTPSPPVLELDASGFDLICEVKLRAPSAGVLVKPAECHRERCRRQALDYARGGAAAISVLTEPTRFDGDLDHITVAAQSVDVPVMRKDFIVDPYQVFEARAAGAGGVLLILRILGDAQLEELLEAAHQMHLFVLLEAFDHDDLDRARRFISARLDRGPRTLVGVNARDLVSLEVDRERFVELAGGLPPGVPGVAESGIEDPDDAARVSALGYSVALVGTSLMLSKDPARRVTALLEAGRSERGNRCVSG